MENLRQKYEITLDDRKIGCAVIEQEGIRFAISAAVSAIDIRKPFRLAARCESRIVPLGIMMPRDGGFECRKIFTKGALRELGISNIVGFTVLPDDIGNCSMDMQSEKEDKEWLAINHVEELLEEGQFRRAFSGCRGCVVRRDADLVYLAVPIVKDKAFPAMPIRCLGEVCKMNGNLYMVFKIYNGKLLF